ncbi:MAG: thiamine pyrophosphate-binding protein [Gammaproteobacteria bacterium]|nr:thiamine pyrophosphate-binding protein [Gammaproteobacteria bacterium]
MNICTEIVEILNDRDIVTAFGIPGIHNLPIYQALHKCGMETYTVRHEQSSSFMADGYARVSGTPALCSVIDGPGFLNASTGIAQARADSVPMVVLTPSGSEQPQGNPHELCGQDEVSKRVCKAHFRVGLSTTRCDIENFVDSNLHLVRQGPIHIEIPLSMSQDELAPHELPVQPGVQKESKSFGNIEAANRLIHASKRPIIVAGGGAVDAQVEVQKFAERIDAPVLNTVNGKGMLPPNHALRVGFSPSLPEINKELQESDLTIAIGTELSEIDFDFFMEGKSRNFQSLIRLDIESNQVKCNAIPDVAIVGDCKVTMPELASAPTDRNGSARAREMRQRAQKSRYASQEMLTFLEVLRQNSDVLVGDSTQPTYYATWLYEPAGVRQYFHSVTGFGTLGYAIPAAIGAKIADRDNRVTSLIGDGGSHFTISEIQSATQFGLGIPFVIWNNQCYGEINKAMCVQSSEVWYESPTPPNFRFLADAYGAKYCRPSNFSELSDLLEESHKRNSPTLIEVSDEEFPEVHMTMNWFDSAGES